MKLIHRMQIKQFLDLNVMMLFLIVKKQMLIPNFVHFLYKVEIMLGLMKENSFQFKTINMFHNLKERKLTHIVKMLKVYSEISCLVEVVIVSRVALVVVMNVIVLFVRSRYARDLKRIVRVIEMKIAIMECTAEKENSGLLQQCVLLLMENLTFVQMSMNAKMINFAGIQMKNTKLTI